MNIRRPFCPDVTNCGHGGVLLFLDLFNYRLEKEMNPRTVRLFILIFCVPFLFLVRPSTTHAETLSREAQTAPDLSAIAAGAAHTCALTTDGGVKCWGANGFGQLGNGTTTAVWTGQSTPANVVGLSSGVSAVAAGDIHTCALTTGGGVKCWGDNWEGVLGNGAGFPSTTPVDVVGLSSGIGAITVNRQHSCALATSGVLRCWGANSVGQLGTNRGWVAADVIWLEEMTFFPLIRR